MSRQTYYLLGVTLPLFPLLCALGGCGSGPAPKASSPTTDTSDPAPTTTAPPPSEASGPSSPRASSLADVEQLGVVGEPNPSPRGLRVKGFSTSSSPLRARGVKAGDVIIRCNRQQGQLGVRIGQALDALQRQGAPITLEVLRDGRTLTLTRSEKLPAAKSEQ